MVNVFIILECKVLSKQDKNPDAIKEMIDTYNYIKIKIS